MNPRDLSKPARVLLAVLLLLASLVALVAVAIGPYYAAQVFAEETALKENELALLERRARSHNRSASQQIVAETNERFKSALLPGPSLGQASGSLQQRVADVVRKAGATLKSQQALEPVRDAELMSIATRFVMDGTIEQLRQVLHALETGLPLVFVDELLVKTKDSNARSGQRGGGAGDERSRVTERVLDVEMRISAFTTREGA